MKAVIRMPFLFFLFACVELFGLIKIGQLIGGAPILGEIILTGVIGVILLRLGAGNAVAGMMVSLLAGQFSLQQILHRRALRFLLAGVLLLVPGLLTDLAGIVLLATYFIPSRKRVSADDVIDVEYEVHDDRSRQ